MQSAARAASETRQVARHPDNNNQHILVTIIFLHQSKTGTVGINTDLVSLPRYLQRQIQDLERGGLTGPTNTMIVNWLCLYFRDIARFSTRRPTRYLPPWLSGLAISGRGAVKAWLAIRQGVGSYPTPAGMSSQVSADYSRARYNRVRLSPR